MKIVDIHMAGNEHEQGDAMIDPIQEITLVVRKVRFIIKMRVKLWQIRRGLRRL